MRGLDGAPDGLDDAAFERALGRGRKGRGSRRLASIPRTPSDRCAAPEAPGPLAADDERRDDPPPRPLADAAPEQCYVDAFDAVSAIGADLVLDDRYHAGASVALAAWAAARGKHVDLRDVSPCDCWSGVLSVVIGTPGTPSHRSIDVYLRSA